MRKASKYAISFACCVLAMPTCVKLLGGFQAESMGAAVAMGVLLGAVHLAVRPVIRIVSAPLGCLTLGLIQPVIDVALIYSCAYLIDGFAVTNILHALLAVILINTVCFIASGRS